MSTQVPNPKGTEETKPDCVTTVQSRKSSTEEEVAERGVVLDFIKEVVQEPEFVDNVAGCCVHFIRATCCAPKKADS
jgi:hypothetical protein